MANAQNLKPFKKGQSGNLNGRPRKVPELDNLLADVLGAETPDGKTAAREILEEIVKAAKRGNLKAAEMLLDRAYGKPKAALEMTGRAGGTIVFRNYVLPDGTTIEI